MCVIYQAHSSATMHTHANSRVTARSPLKGEAPRDDTHTLGDAHWGQHLRPEHTCESRRKHPYTPVTLALHTRAHNHALVSTPSHPAAAPPHPPHTHTHPPSTLPLLPISLSPNTGWWLKISCSQRRTQTQHTQTQKHTNTSPIRPTIHVKQLQGEWCQRPSAHH